MPTPSSRYSSLGLLVLVASKVSCDSCTACQLMTRLPVCQLFDTSGTLSHLFSDSEIKASSGTLVVLCFLVNALFGSVSLTRMCVGESRVFLT